MGTVFLAIAPALAMMYFFHLEEWAGFLVGLLALAAAWFGGERFILRQVRALYNATRRLAAGDLSSRTGLGDAKGELGQLASTFDTMAESLQQRAREREETERTLVNRALQQTVVAALGQFALVGNDLNALLNQAVMLVTQTLDVEFCGIHELLPDSESMILRAGVGWKRGLVGSATASTSAETQAGYTLATGEPVVVEDFRNERRHQPPPLLVKHGIAGSVTVAIAPRQRTFGVLGVHTTTPRKFTGEEVHFLISVATALALAVERTRAEAELQKLAVFAQLNPNAALELKPDGTITYFNDAALKLALSVQKDHPRDVLPPDLKAILENCLGTGRSQSNVESQVEGRTLAWSFHPVGASRLVHCYVEDITERLNLEGQLLQAQKMESVGQLAAGVAHDFNNMLTIIQGHAGMLISRPQLPQVMKDSVQAISFAAERAASLTRQLLMFSRKNVMQLNPLDLRDVVGNMSKMLQRILGETITLEYHPPAALPLVEADAGMVEQVVMNLAVNARDAMPKGGTLSISLSTVEISPEYLRLRPEARPGTFVCLRVTDTGSGMDAATMSRIFEPFYTTKEIGKGTGLGLATVYGIIKQHDGWIEVASEPGRGTTFNAFFGATTNNAHAAKQDTDPTAFIRGGHETILIVEDEPVIRELARLILQECGYHILEAANGREAIAIWERHRQDIALLLTDMVMPEGVSGVELAEQLLAQQARLKIIFASGYTVDDLSTDFLKRNNHAHFLQKPYSRVNLARTVRQALDGIHPQPIPATVA